METEAKDYVYAGSLIALILAATVLILLALHDWLASVFGVFSAIVLFIVLALAYGGLTALALTILAAWQPLREGEYTLDHSQFTLWKVQHVVGELGKVALSLFFPVFARPAFYALFGAPVGQQVAVAGKILDPQLTVLEDRCVLGEGCTVTSHTMVHDRFILRSVRVGSRATVGIGSILMPGVIIGAGAIVLPGAVLKTGTKVPAGETWGGVPAARVKAAD